MMKNPNWTDDEKEMTKEMWVGRPDISVATIAEVLEMNSVSGVYRSRSAIIGMANREGWPTRFGMFTGVPAVGVRRRGPDKKPRASTLAKQAIVVDLRTLRAAKEAKALEAKLEAKRAREAATRARVEKIQLGEQSVMRLIDTTEGLNCSVLWCREIIGEPKHGHICGNPVCVGSYCHTHASINLKPASTTSKPIGAYHWR